MPTNDFKAVAIAPAAVTLSQVAYLAFLAANPNGWPSGIVPATRMNKTIRQSSVISAAVAQFICDNLGVDVLDPDAGVTVATITGQLTTTVKTMIDVQSGNYCLDTGAANAYVIATDPVTVAYVNGEVFRFKVANANTGASTLNCGPGAKSLVNDVGGALANGDLPLGFVVTCVYDLPSDKLLLTTVVASQFVPTVLRNYLGGCGCTNGTDTVNDIDVAAGQTTDSTNTVMIAVAAMAGKQLDVGWAPGAAAGMRNSGVAIANTTYHIYAVAKANGTQDIYAHTSTVVATVITALQAEAGGASYIYARRIFSIVRAGATILQFIQDGDLVQWAATVLDITAVNPGTAAVTRTLTLPLGINIQAVILALMANSGAGVSGQIRMSDLAVNDEAVTSTNTDNSPTATSANNIFTCGVRLVVRTNTSAQIRSRLAASDGSVTFSVRTLGYIDSRGR